MSAGVAGASPGAATISKSLPHSVRTVLSDAAGTGYAGDGIAIDADTVAVGDNGTVTLYPLSAATPESLKPTLLKPPSGALGFGGTIALNGNTLVLGALDSTEDSLTNAGSAYIYQRGPGGWRDVSTPIATLVSPNPTTNGTFGISAAVQGDTVVVGAPGESSNDGRTYVFTKPVTGWAGSAPGYATLSTAGTGSETGSSVAIDGNSIVAGAPMGSPVVTNSGELALYTEPATGGWKDAAPTRVLTDRIPVPDQEVGASIAIAGNVIVAGGSNGTIGRLDVYVKPAAGWNSGYGVQTATIVDSSLVSGSGLGKSVAIDGSKIVAGAPFATVSGHESAGVFDVFDKPTAGWSDLTTPTEQVSDTTPTDNAYFGLNVGLEGSRIVVGAPRANLIASEMFARGAAYLYTALPVPSLTSVKESQRSWKPDTHLPKLNAKNKPKGGTTYRFTANQAMPVALDFAKKNKHGKYGKAKALTVVATKGKNVVYFGGRLTTSVKLSAGKYHVVLQAKNAAGDLSAVHTLHFTIK
jgi:FG-GAP repeat